MLQAHIPHRQYPGIVGFENIFTNKEIDLINKYASSLPLQKGQTQGNMMGLAEDHKDNPKRSCEIKWIYPSEQNEWVLNKIIERMSDVNFKFFTMDLSSFEPIQYTIYNAPSDTYGAHTDLVVGASNVHRKLSFTIQLSDPSEYKGGDLKLYDIDLSKPQIANKKKGSITFFYSHIFHEITPVTSGTRLALVGWFSGPPLK